MSAAEQQDASPLQSEMIERGDILVLKVSGMAAVEVSGQFSRVLQEAAARNPKILAVDLSGLSFVSSTGLGGLVAAHVTCQRNGTKMYLLKPRPFINEILEVTKLCNLFKVCDSLEEIQRLAASE